MSRLFRTQGVKAFYHFSANIFCGAVGQQQPSPILPEACLDPNLLRNEMFLPLPSSTWVL